MKEYCVDLEIAKELKENGFAQETYFRYQIDMFGEVEIETIEFSVHDHVTEIYNTPISEEILKELPKEIKDPDFKYFYHLKIEKSSIYDEMYFVSYGITSPDRFWMETYRTDDKKPSNALAKMWLLLKKEGYIK